MFRAENFNLFENELMALFLVLNSLKLVDNNEEVSLLIAGSFQKLLGGRGEVILSRNHEDNNDDFLLACEDSSSLDAVTVEARCIN